MKSTNNTPALQSLLCLLFWVVTSSHAETPLTAEQITRFANTTQAQSLDDLIGKLAGRDSNIFSRWTPIYGTRGMQSGDRTHPRIMTVNPISSGFVAMTFNGHPFQRHYEALEFLEFDVSKPEFSLHQVTLHSGQWHHEKNPPQCLTCHGDHARPIWDSYPLWPGVPSIDYKSFEDQHLKDFESLRSEHPRYKYLSSNYLKSDDGLLAFHIEGMPQTKFQNLDNLFSETHEYYLAVKLYEQMSSDPKLWPFRYYALAVAFDTNAHRPFCLTQQPESSRSFLPEKTVNQWSGNFNQLWEDTISRYRASVDFRVRQIHKQFPGASIPPSLGPMVGDVVAWRWFLENNGISMLNWSMMLPRNTYNFRSSSQKSFLFFPGFFLTHWRKNASLEDKILFDRFNSSPNQKNCRVLQDASMNALKDF